MLVILPGCKLYRVLWSVVGQISAVGGVSDRAGGVAGSGDAKPLQADTSFFLRSPFSNSSFSSILLILTAVPGTVFRWVLESALQAGLVEGDLQLLSCRASFG